PLARAPGGTRWVLTVQRGERPAVEIVVVRPESHWGGRFLPAARGAVPHRLPESRRPYRPSRVAAPRACSQTSALRGEPLTRIQDALLDEVGAAADATGGRETRGHPSRTRGHRHRFSNLG